jgi:alpha-tubulin suppressor-like RCC1 family protein
MSQRLGFQSKLKFFLSCLSVIGLIGTTLSSLGITTNAATDTWSVWGNNIDGEYGNGKYSITTSITQVPSVSGVKYVSNSAGSSLIQHEDGTVSYTGSNRFGQAGLGFDTYAVSQQKVAGLSNIKQIANAGNFMMALDVSGNVWVWGSGNLGLGVDSVNQVPKKITSLTNIKQIAATEGNGFALKTDKTVVAWGLNISGELGQNNKTAYSSPTAVNVSNIVSLHASAYSICALNATQTLYCWGENSSGNLGNGATNDVLTPQSTHTNIVQVSKSTGLGFVIRNSSGAYYSFGQGFNLGPNSSGTNPTPTLLTLPSGVDKVFVTSRQNYAYNSNTQTLYTYGYNDNNTELNANTTVNVGNVGIGSIAVYAVPNTNQSMTGFKDIFGYSGWAGYVGSDSKMYGVGSDGLNQYGDIGQELDSPISLQYPTQYAGIIQVANNTIIGSGGLSIGLKQNGKLVQWGVKIGNTNANLTPTEVTPVGTVSTEPNSIAVFNRAVRYYIDTNGDLYGWGSETNSTGGLGGLNGAASLSTPKLLASSSATRLAAVNVTRSMLNLNEPNEKLTKILTLSGYAVAMSDKGNVYTWGNQTSTNSSLGNTRSSATNGQPVSVSNPSGLPFNATFFGAINGGAKDIKAFESPMILTNDGSVFAVGSNTQGRLGNDLQQTNVNIWTKINSLSNVTNLYGEGSIGATFAKTSNGNYYVWGPNYSYQASQPFQNYNDTAKDDRVLFSPIQINSVPNGTVDIFSQLSGRTTYFKNSDGKLYRSGSVTGAGEIIGNESNITPILMNNISNVTAYGYGSGDVVYIKGDTTNVTPLEDGDIAGINFDCDNAVIGYNTTCIFTLPAGKSLPWSFRMGTGDATPSGQCTKNNASNEVKCVSVPVGNEAGSSDVFGKIDTNVKVDTGENITVHALNEDQDNDGLDNTAELTKTSTDPFKNDTDGDQILDGMEDSDADGLGNAVEITNGTDPGNDDSENPNTTVIEADNDIKDGAEDWDEDGLNNAVEFSDVFKSDPNDDDSDFGVTANINEANNSKQDGEEDVDNDGLINKDEITNNTDPYSNDSDDDGVSDGDEIFKTRTDPTNANSDSSATANVDESTNTTSDKDEDLDGDGYSNEKELTADTNPLVSTDRPSEYLTATEIQDSSVACTTAGVNTTTTCTFNVKPYRIYNGFTLYIGADTVGNACPTTPGQTTVTCANVPTGTQAGTQTIYANYKTSNITQTIDVDDLEEDSEEEGLLEVVLGKIKAHAQSNERIDTGAKVQITGTSTTPTSGGSTTTGGGVLTGGLTTLPRTGGIVVGGAILGILSLGGIVFTAQRRKQVKPDLVNKK